jgi:uncharacterized protein (UPF0264 family)
MASKLLDRESNEFLALMRERNLLINAIAEIEIELNNPLNGALYSDFGWMINNIIANLKKKESN